MAGAYQAMPQCGIGTSMHTACPKDASAYRPCDEQLLISDDAAMSSPCPTWNMSSAMASSSAAGACDMHSATSTHMSAQANMLALVDSLFASLFTSQPG